MTKAVSSARPRVAFEVQERSEAVGRRAGSVDAEIGQRIRRLRNTELLSQEELASRIGISCQQLQKYESGANRISASRLVQLADALKIEISRFLRDQAASDASALAPASAGGLAAGQPNASEIMRLLTAYCGISNQASRAKIVEMATFLAELESSGPPR